MESKQIKTCKAHENVNYKWFISKEIKYCYQTCSVLTSSTLLQLQSWKTSFKNWHKIYLPIWMSNRIELPMSLSSFISGFRQNPHHLQLKTNKPGRECPQHKCLWESGSFWIILQAKAALFVHFSTLNKKPKRLFQCLVKMWGSQICSIINSGNFSLSKSHWNTQEVALFVYLGYFDGPRLAQLRHYFLTQLSQIHLLSFAEFSSGNPGWECLDKVFVSIHNLVTALFTSWKYINAIYTIYTSKECRCEGKLLLKHREKATFTALKAVNASSSSSCKCQWSNC